MLLNPMDVARRLVAVMAAFFLAAALAAVAKSSEPPQVNLPGYNQGLCKCGVACECGDAFTVIHKAPAATKAVQTPPAKAQGPSYAIEKRYVRQGRRLFVQDVMVEVSQPPDVSYAVPAQSVTYQSPRLDCSSGTCRYLR